MGFKPRALDAAHIVFKPKEPGTLLTKCLNQKSYVNAAHIVSKSKEPGTLLTKCLNKAGSKQRPYQLLNL